MQVIVRCRGSTLALAGVLLLTGPVAAAPSATTMLHRGGSDPAREGWPLLAAGTDPGLVESGRETTASGEHAFWRVQDRITDGLQAYRQPLPPAASERAWRLSAVLRIVDSPVITFHDGVGGTGLVVADGQNYWSFYLTNTQVGPVGDWAGGASAYHLARTLRLDTRTDYHEYGILFDPAGPGTADDSADFFVDGRLVFDNVPRKGLFETPQEFVHFGATSLPGLSDAHYSWVCFEGELPPTEARIPPSAARGCNTAPTPTATATATDSPTRTPTASSTPTPIATESASPSPSSSPTPTASTTATPTPPPPPSAAPCVPAHRASDIALVLDRSSSMNSANELGAAVAAINQFVDGVQAPPDQLALVTFANVAGLNQPLTSNKSTFRRALSAVVTGNGTRIDLGLQRAREELSGPRAAPSHAPVVVLLSDGVQASGEEAPVVAEADAARAAGIVVFTIAFGADADIDMLRRVATSPAYAFVAATNAELATIYGRIAAAIPCPATATLAPVAATATGLPSAAATAGTPSSSTPTADASRTAAEWVIFFPLAGSPIPGAGSRNAAPSGSTYPYGQGHFEVGGDGRTMKWSGDVAWGRGRPARFGPCGSRKDGRLARVGRPRAGGTPAPPEWWTRLP